MNERTIDDFSAQSSVTLRAACVIAILCSLTLQTAECQPLIPGITGDDDRSLVTTTEYPWQAVGRLNNTLGPFCTGILIGPRRVLTAAHCLWNSSTRSWLPPCALHFLAGYQRGSYLAHSLVIDYELVGGEAFTAQGPPGDPGSDWAVLILAENLSAAVSPVPTASFDASLLTAYRADEGVFMQAGYSRDRPHILTLNRPCELTGFADSGRIVLHLCDATFGDSGSPILVEREGEYHVVAMVLGIDGHTDHGVAVTGAAFHDSLQQLPASPTFTDAAEAC